MKYLLVTVLGLVLGIGAGIAALYYNPLTVTGAQASAAESVLLEYEFPETDSMILTHGGRDVLPRVPPQVNELWESTIKKLMVNAVVLKDADGIPRALASRTSVPSAATDLLFKGALVTDHWLVTVPGEGSFVLQMQNNLWPFVKDTLIPVRYLGRAWQGPKLYQPTVGPLASGVGAVYGATGRFADSSGTGRESYRLDSFSRARGVAAALGRLHLNFAALEPRGEELSQADLE
jgi:hypothetical protein